MKTPVLTSTILAFSVFLAVLAPFRLTAADTGVRPLALDPAPAADNTAAFQSALDSGSGALFVPAGKWRIGTVRIPADVTLTFDPKARLVPVPEKITDQNLFVVTGDRVRIEGIHFDFAEPLGRPAATKAKDSLIQNLVYADSVNDLIVSGAHVENSTPRGLIPLEKRARRGSLLNPDGTDPGSKEHYSHIDYYLGQVLLKAVNSSHITLENSSGERLHAMLSTIDSANVTARGNRMISGNSLTTFAEGGENLRHHDNWSRDVKYQVIWFGGSPDPSRKASTVPLGSSTVVHRDIKRGDAGYNRHTSGSFDVFVQNNYAEYGNTLAWGNKARQVVIDGNVARFISDYAYGTEGGENLVFSNNISINSTSGGIVSMYWGEKLLITGNLVIVRHEPWDPKLSWWDNPSKYFGPFVRLHHGPSNKEDRYGAGAVHIDGNLFVSELTQRSTTITIQRGRDVTISGNKFINGRIDKVDQGRLTVMNNEFVSRLPIEDLIVGVKGRADTVLIQGNILRRESGADRDSDKQAVADESQPVPDLLFTDEDDAARAQAQVTGTETTTPVKANSPAFAFAPTGAFFGLVQGNFVYGWKDALSLQPAKNTRVSLVVTGNTTDGALATDLPADRSGIKIENNTTLPPGLMPR